MCVHVITSRVSVYLASAMRVHIIVFGEGGGANSEVVKKNSGRREGGQQKDGW